MIVRLSFAALRIDGEARSVDAVGVGEAVGNCFGAAFRELQVVSACTGVFVSISADGHVKFGILLELLCNVEYIDHFLIGDLCRVDGESYSCEYGSDVDVG